MQNDAEIIARVVAGDADSYRALVKRYETKVFCLVRNLIRDVHQIEDIAQETFLAAYESLRSYDARQAAFSTWLLTIARNKCLKAIKRHRPITMEHLPETLDLRTPEENASRNEFYAHLDAALDQLPFPQKTAFVLSEIQGLTLQEIGQIERVKVGTVKSRISRAKEKLRQILGYITRFFGSTK